MINPVTSCRRPPAELAEQKVLQGSLDLKNLAAGSYRCTHVCHVSTGEDIVVRDFTFDK